MAARVNSSPEPPTNMQITYHDFMVLFVWQVKKTPFHASRYDIPGSGQRHHLFMKLLQPVAKDGAYSGEISGTSSRLDVWAIAG